MWSASSSKTTQEVNLSTPQTSALAQNYPNPLNPETRIQYQVPEASLIQLKIYNLRGQEIRTLVRERQDSGAYSVPWDGKNDSGNEVSSGLYIYRIPSNRIRRTTTVSAKWQDVVGAVVFKK